MNKRKSYLIPTLYLLVLFLITIGVYLTKNAFDKKEESTSFQNINFVTNNILNRTMPIINIPVVIGKPYANDNISIIRYFYNSSDDINQKEKAIVFYGDTYMPNSGIDYTSEDSFDVLSIYDGTVVDVSNDEILGKSVRIRHNSEVISVYQSIDDIEVKSGDVVFKGQKIANSGTNKIDLDRKNMLHFELIKNGEAIDPLKCINKSLGDI